MLFRSLRLQYLGAGVANLAEVLQPQGRLSPVTVSRLEMQPLFESLAAEWEHGAAAQIEICLALHRMLALMARQLLAGDESRSNRTSNRPPSTSASTMPSRCRWTACWPRRR